MKEVIVDSVTSLLVYLWTNHNGVAILMMTILAHEAPTLQGLFWHRLPGADVVRRILVHQHKVVVATRNLYSQKSKAEQLE